MNKKEAHQMIEVYKQQFSYYLLSNESEMEKLMLQGQKHMMKLFFTNEEINRFENGVRVSSPYLRELFESVES